MAALELASARAATALDTVQSYYEAVLAHQLVTIAEASLLQAENTFRQVKLGGEQGTRPEFDVLRAQVAVENQRPQLLSTRLQRDRAQLRLKQLLDIPLERNLVLTSALDKEDLHDLGSLSRQIANLLPSAVNIDQPRVAVQQALANVDIREAAVYLARSQHWPSLTAVSSYGWSAFPESGLPDSKEWNKTWAAGLQMTIPIFTGLRIQGEVHSAEAELREAQARANQAKEQAALDTRSALDELAAAKAQWEAVAGTVTQAERAYQIAELRYRDGISTQLELADARLLLQQAQANRARAARDVQVARVRVALLPYLPLNGGVMTRRAASSLLTGQPENSALGPAPSSQEVGGAL